MAEIDLEDFRGDCRPPLDRPSGRGALDGVARACGRDRPVLAFGSEGETLTVVVDFDDDVWDLSNKDLQRFLDEGRDESLTPWEHDGGHH